MAKISIVTVMIRITRTPPAAKMYAILAGKGFGPSYCEEGERRLNSLTVLLTGRGFSDDSEKKGVPSLLLSLVVGLGGPVKGTRQWSRMGNCRSG